MKIQRISALTNQVHIHEINVTQKQLDEWRSGALIQNVMPHLSPADREFIMTGTTEEEFTEAFGCA